MAASPRFLLAAVLVLALAAAASVDAKKPKLTFNAGDPTKGMHGLNAFGVIAGHHPPGVGHHPPGSGHHPNKFGHKNCNKNASICLDPRYNPVFSPTCCSKSCVDTSTSLTNCGFCFNVCGFGLTCCNGTCSNLLVDVNNCGKCGVKCVPDATHPVPTCQFGICNY
eukprot:SM000351S13214  [mRNA]  locus=s351:33736:34937:- [translate_table: standard]